MPDEQHAPTAAELRSAYDVLRALVLQSIGNHVATDFHVLSGAAQLVHEQLLVAERKHYGERSELRGAPEL